MSENDPTVERRRVTQAELARELGVSRQAINDLIRRNVLTFGMDDRLDLEEARVVILERVRPSSKTATAAAPAGAPVAAPAVDAPTAADSAAGYHLARAQREATEASIAALRLQQMQGELINREAAIQAAYTAFRTLRDTINFMPRKLAGQMVGVASARDAQTLLEAAVREALDDFQRKVLAKMATGMGAQLPADSEGTEP